MPTPFPGMDPYLEAPAVWPAFHHQFVVALHQVLQPGLTGERYQSRVRERRYQVDLTGTDSEQRENFIEVTEANSGNLVTLIDSVSPANKTTAPGRQAFLDTRQQAKDQTANIVEIDLVLQGEPMLDYSRDGLPTWDYAVTVTRMTYPERYEIYTATVQKRLPRFRVPLAANDRDTVVDLQAVFLQAFEAGDFGNQIDHQREPTTAMDDDAFGRIRELLNWPVRSFFTHGEIAPVAYAIWQQEGCLHGRADEHWRLAIEQLKRPQRKASE